MKYEFHLLFLMIGIGLMTRKLKWQHWFFVALLVFSWIMYCWKYR